MLHWSYTPEQKEEVKKALAAGVPKATILTYFYPEVVGLVMIGIGWYKKAKCDKKVFKYMEEHEEV